MELTIHFAIFITSISALTKINVMLKKRRKGNTPMHFSLTMGIYDILNSTVNEIIKLLVSEKIINTVNVTKKL